MLAMAANQKTTQLVALDNLLATGRALQLRREARMVSPAMGAAMMGTMYFLWAGCAQHGGKAGGGGLVCVSLRSYRALATANVSCGC